MSSEPSSLAAPLLDPRILPIGSIVRMDADGYFPDSIEHHPLTSTWDQPVQELVAEYNERLGSSLHSLYLRGSLIRGTAIEGVSDVDLLLLVDGDAATIDWSWLRPFHVSLTKKYPFMNGVDLGINNLDRVLNGGNKTRAFLLKVMSECIQGEDIRGQLPRVKLGRDALIARWQFRERTSPDFLAGSKASLEDRVSLIGKQIVRAGMELVMEEEGYYSRDLYPCYETFARHYPEKATVMARALTQALFSAESEADFAEMRDDISPWLADELDKKYPEL